MPRNFGSPFWRVTVAGSLYTAEQWSISLSVVGATDLGQPTQEHANAIGAAVQSTLIRPASGFGLVTGQAVHSFTKVARIGSDGLYGEAEAVIYNQPLSGAGGSGTGTALPPQISLAVTLLGANPRGAAGRGRFYLPAPAVTMAADGRISEADALRIANGAAAMINAINAAVPGAVAIVGPETVTGRAPARQMVEAVKVGRVLDTIRSRRSKFPEEAKVAATQITGFGGGGGDF